MQPSFCHDNCRATCLPDFSLSLLLFFWENNNLTTLSLRQILLLPSYGRLHSPAFRQRYPTTNAQDKSSSVMVGRHFWFPAALWCDLLDAPLSLWWWRNRSCTFSSLEKTMLPETETDAFSAFEKLAFVPGNSYQSLVFLFICLFLNLKSLLCSD